VNGLAEPPDELFLRRLERSRSVGCRGLSSTSIHTGTDYEKWDADEFLWRSVAEASPRDRDEEVL